MNINGSDLCKERSKEVNSGVLAFWGKYSKDKKLYHPLIFHCLDAANVSIALLQNGFAGLVCRHFAERTELKNEEVINLIGYLVALHDIGKAIPSFQDIINEHQSILTEAGFQIPSCYTNSQVPHGQASYHIAQEVFQGPGLNLPKPAASNLAHALAAHHGMFVTPGPLFPK